ncbi:MAG TPA: dTDP-4-dehydrorhamnose 3,5-epimerase family protein [Gemmataceae bacterium]|nr:dTDP-4-dehydrorhamnose 3,5-epimerase family protein [Gemmataceae bacterium]
MGVEPFRNGPIEDIVWRPLKRFDDKRGWLCELFRSDDIGDAFRPEMGYLSLSWAGVARGPHEHVEQADLFCFLGPGDFKVYLWDNRPHSPTYWHQQAQVIGSEQPTALIIPPGIVHAYKNVSTQPGLVYNFPNQLYKGKGRTQAVDEIRHEDDPNTVFVLD